MGVALITMAVPRLDLWQHVGRGHVEEGAAREKQKLREHFLGDSVCGARVWR